MNRSECPDIFPGFSRTLGPHSGGDKKNIRTSLSDCPFSIYNLPCREFFQVFIDTLSRNMVYCPMRPRDAVKLSAAPPAMKRRAVLGKRRPRSSGGRTEYGQEVSYAWQRNVPISPRSSTARRSTASASAWPLPTAARFWPAAAPRAAPASLIERQETLEHES